MRQFIAVILFTLFNLGAFGVTIKQHLCCHSQQQEESASNHCTDDESCCGDNEDCCDEIVSQVKIAKDYNSNSFKINIEASAFIAPKKLEIQDLTCLPFLKIEPSAASLKYFAPPEDFQIIYNSFLI